MAALWRRAIPAAVDTTAASGMPRIRATSHRSRAADARSNVVTAPPRFAATAPFIWTEAEATAIEALVDSLKSADALLRTHARGDGPFVGDAFGHVEEAAAPFACRLTRLLPALRPQHSIDAMLAEHKLDRLKAWLDAVTDRPSCTSTMPTKEEMVDSSKKMMARIKAMAK